MKEHVLQTLRHFNFETEVAGAYVNTKDSSFVFVGWGSDDEKSIILEFCPGGSLESHRQSEDRDTSENAIEDLECDSDFIWIDLN